MDHQEAQTETTEGQRKAIAHMIDGLQNGAKMAEVFGYDEETLMALESQAYRLYQNQRFDQAKIAGRGVLALDDERMLTQVIMGDMALEEYRFSDAVDHLQKAHRLAPEECGIRARLGEALLKSGKKQLASKHLEAVVAAGEEAGENNLRRSQLLLDALRS